jgi:uroporphyrinogen decarboxylase
MKTEDKLLLRALRGVPVERHPFWLMRQAGRYLPEYRKLRAHAGSFLSLCFNPDLATEVTLQPVHRYGMDAAILFSDILVVPLGLGQELSFQEGEGPKLEPIRDTAALARLSASLDLARLEPIYETVRRVRQELPPETALIGFAGAPWTVATYVVEGGSSREFFEVKGWAAADEPGFAALIDCLTQATIAHLTAQVAAGAEIVQLFDSWAGALDGEAFHKWVVEPTRQIVTALKAVKPNLPIIGFPKGAGAKYLGYARETGVDVLALDQDVPLAFAREMLQPVAAVQGNLDPNLLVAGGPAMETRIREILSVLGKGRFVFNLGHGILPTTSLDHVERLSEILRTTPARG